MNPADPWPDLVADYLLGSSDGAALLAATRREVGHLSRRLPDAWFSLGRKDEESLADLSHRVFWICDRVPRGRFPFQGRAPYPCFVAEQMDGRAIRYHSFYSKLSVARELLRADYARNIVRDPRLRAEAAAWRGLTAALRAVAIQEEGKAGPWRLVEVRGPALLLSPERLGEHLARRAAEAQRRGSPLPLAALVAEALHRGGPLRQASLFPLLRPFLSEEPSPEPAPTTEAAPDETAGPEALNPADRLWLREAVLRAWSELEPADQSLLTALARGASYDELIASTPAFKHRVAVTRAVERCNRHFLERILGEGKSKAAEAPQRLTEAILELLVELLPSLDPTAELAHGA
jgi:hypothetical protein